MLNSSCVGESSAWELAIHSNRLGWKGQRGQQAYSGLFGQAGVNYRSTWSAFQSCIQFAVPIWLKKITFIWNHFCLVSVRQSPLLETLEWRTAVKLPVNCYFFHFAVSRYPEQELPGSISSRTCALMAESVPTGVPVCLTNSFPCVSGEILWLKWC